MTPRAAILLTALALAACGREPLRVATPAPPPAERIGIGFASVEVLDVSLPLYATDERIYVQDAKGAVVRSGAVWADEAARAVTLDLTRALSAVTGARVAPSPWPFAEPADAELDVRISTLIPDLATGTYRLEGQVYVGAFDLSGRDRSRDVILSVPLPPEAGPADYAAARSALMSALAAEIARGALR